MFDRFRRIPHRVGNLNMTNLKGVVINERLVFFKDLKFYVKKNKNAEEGFFTVFAKRKFMHSKGDLYVGERTPISPSEYHDDPTKQIHEGWGDGSSMVEQESGDQQPKSS